MKHTRMGTASLAFCLSLLAILSKSADGEERSKQCVYVNLLTPIKTPQPLLADHPEFIEPIRESNRYEAATLESVSVGEGFCPGLFVVADPVIG